MSQNINIMTSVPVTYKGLFKWSCKLFKKLGWIGLMKQQCIDNKSPQFILFYESKLKSYIKSVMALDCAINNKLETPALKENNLKRDDLLILKTQNGRYELSLEHLYEVNPTAAKQFDEYLQHETE